MKRVLLSTVLDRLISVGQIRQDAKESLLNDLIGVLCDTAVIVWKTGDVVTCAQEMGKLIKEDEASDVINDLEHDHDASIGVNWQTIKNLIEHMDLPSLPNPVRDSYENGECPDCGDEIPLDVEDGQSCDNCGHVFCHPKPTDD